ncbi:hypothetical protein JXA34_03435 [Patescibacteria group bacterium]|nr:hypothetical protein [Patescibacteria group bacterium]
MTTLSVKKDTEVEERNWDVIPTSCTMFAREQSEIEEQFYINLQNTFNKKNYVTWYLWNEYFYGQKPLEGFWSFARKEWFAQNDMWSDALYTWNNSIFNFSFLSKTVQDIESVEKEDDIFVEPQAKRTYKIDLNIKKIIRGEPILTIEFQDKIQ